jgi:hypothetical protein
MPRDLVVRNGAIIAFRIFDIAHAIDLKKAEALLASQARAARRIQLTATPAKAMAFEDPPLSLTLAPVTLHLDQFEATAEVTARIYDFGAMSLALHIPVVETEWPVFVAALNAMNQAVGPASATPVWPELLESLRLPLAPALSRPDRSPLQEDYLVGLVQEFDEPLSAAALLERVDLVPLLSGEQRALSDGARHELLRQRFSYYTDDLVVLTWDRAFICEPRGDSDVIDVIELANAQLLETRYYDELLDAELPRMYDMVDSARRTTSMFASRRYSNLARRLYTLVAEVTELTEKVDNALQVTEDVYLARVYAAALEVFRVQAVGAAVDRKLAIIRDTYAALHDEAAGSRTTFLEILVVILIALEIVLPFLHR